MKNKFLTTTRAIGFALLFQMLLIGVIGQSNDARPASQQGPQLTIQDSVLKQRVGTWDATIEIQTAPDKPPMIAKGVEVDELSPDGKWLISNFSTENYMGRPFRGYALTGYDPVKSKYIGIWIDTMNRRFSRVEGSYDSKAKLFTTTSREQDEKSGRMIEMQQVTDESNPDVRVVSFPSQMTDEKGPFRMTITYRRRK